ncbi:hypothetical protein [Flagellimonas sp.]|uniref:hypothetical protein n=1 Tax=Flagellimonas sp. TaxID=2058762 RepID=UPI003F4A16D0
MRNSNRNGTLMLALGLLSICLLGQTEKTDLKKVISEYENMIGTCHCKSIFRDQKGAWNDTINLTWNWKYIMDQKGIQDEGWYFSNGRKYHFTSIRVFDTINKQWYVSYFTPNLSSVPETWVGGKQGNEIVLKKEEATENGLVESILTFSNISKKGFDWEGKVMNKEKEMVYPFWKIWCLKEE